MKLLFTPWTVLIVGNNLYTPGICKTMKTSSIRHLFGLGGWVGGSPPILSLFGFSEMSDNCRPPLTKSEQKWRRQKLSRSTKMPKIESEKIDCLHRPCSRPAPQAKIKSVRTHSEVIEQFDSFSLLKLLFLVRNWHCWSRKAFTRQMTPQIREETAKTAVFRQRWQAWKVVRSIAAVRQRPRTPRNWRCSFAFFESFLWHFNKKQHAEVIFRLSRPVCVKIRKMAQGSNDLSTLPLTVLSKSVARS